MSESTYGAIKMGFIFSERWTFSFPVILFSSQILKRNFSFSVGTHHFQASESHDRDYFELLININFASRSIYLNSVQ